VHLEARVFWGKAAYGLIKVEDTDNRTTLTGGNAYNYIYFYSCILGHKWKILSREETGTHRTQGTTWECI
jgi:hypothetical protein